MGFLDKLWDETLAGPKPESGLGKLRKYDSFSGVRPPPIVTDEIPVSRSITILRSNSSIVRNSSSGSAPASPAGSSTPGSPFSPGTPRGDFKRITRRKSTSEALERAEPRSATVYDWYFLSHITIFRVLFFPFISLSRQYQKFHF